MQIFNFPMYFAPIPCTHPKEVPSRELLKGDLGSPGGISLRNGHRTTIKHKKNLVILFPVPQALDWTITSLCPKLQFGNF